MLKFQSVRLALAGLLTFATAEFVMGEIAIGWHDRVPVWLWCFGHGLTIALTIRTSAAEKKLPLWRVFLAYYIVCKTGALLTCISFGVIPPFLFDSMDWFVYISAFFYVFGNDHVYNVYLSSPALAGLCTGLSYVSTVYSITVPVKMAAELSLNELHTVMSNAEGGDTCIDLPHHASIALLHAASWPIFLGILSSCGASVVMHTLKLHTGEWGADIMAGVANTFAWAAVCVPAAVAYELTTNQRSNTLLGCVAPYQPSALAHLEADTLVATWLLANHTLEWAADNVFGGQSESKPPETEASKEKGAQAQPSGEKPQAVAAGESKKLAEEKKDD